MFNEDEDWNDEQETQVLLKSAHINTQKANSPNVKTKLVGKKSLLRTLQTLGSVPEWKTNDHQQDSDSETEAARPHSKKKKKRSKKRKRVGTTAEQQEEGDVDQTFKEEEEEHIPIKKENKKGSSKVKATQRKNKDTTQSTKVIVKNPDTTDCYPDTTEKMSRKQWKNKTKNKRKCNNKYRQNGPEREVNNAESTAKDKPNEEVQTESYNSEIISQTPAKTKENERKLKIRKNTEGGHSCPTQTQTLKEEKQIKKEKKTKGCKVERSATIFFDGSKQKVEEPEVEITDNQQEITIKRAKHELRQQSLKRERLRKMLHCQENDKQDSVEEMSDEPAVQQEEEEEEVEEELKQDRSASLRARMEQRLESARFRYINEILYSTSSGEAKRMFTQDHEAFWIYHRGYTAQVQRWPTNPVDEIIAYIRHKPSTVVVADFGCGDCKIARSVKNKVHSFDLAATCELVTVCDMANVPLCDASVGIAVFCLSLMGTNLPDFLIEANRVLKNGGILKIAEVASRFENVRSFITALAGLGFKMVSMDTANTHFCSFEFMKTGGAPENIKKFGLQLKPCLYKKR